MQEFCTRGARLGQVLGRPSKRSATMSWRGAYRENFRFSYLPDGRKWPFPCLTVSLRRSLKQFCLKKQRIQDDYKHIFHLRLSWLAHPLWTGAAPGYFDRRGKTGWVIAVLGRGVKGRGREIFGNLRLLRCKMVLSLVYYLNWSYMAEKCS